MENYKIHNPVLLNEVIQNFDFQPGQVYVDATAGYGGHSQVILEKLSKGTLVCLDQDLESIAYLKKLFKNHKNVFIKHCNYDGIKTVLSDFKIDHVDGILADLGVSSKMLDDPNRGFSYQNDGPIDMRMDQSKKINAWYLVNKYSQKDLIRIFKEYGEARNASLVAAAIIKYRSKQTIETTKQLSEIIKMAITKKVGYSKKHPAKQYFQAIRIAVNEELVHLKKFLTIAPTLLKKHGILQVISFHSLEDRIVKNTFNNLVNIHIPKEVPIIETPKEFVIRTKKPITPSHQEIASNHRSHSAKLRIIQKN